MKYFARITVDPEQLDGVPCVRDLGIPVASVLRLLTAGVPEEDILLEFPGLELPDIDECLHFAVVAAMEEETPVTLQ
jgi:uncharacterized protein (DUF433 family)